MWSLFSVLLSFLIGLVFALALNNERLRGETFTGLSYNSLDCSLFYLRFNLEKWNTQ